VKATFVRLQMEEKVFLDTWRLRARIYICFKCVKHAVVSTGLVVRPTSGISLYTNTFSPHGGEGERKRLERDFFKGVPSARIAPTRMLLHALQAPFLQSKSMNYLNSPRVGVRLNAY
jgi:hypothetical protein